MALSGWWRYGEIDGDRLPHSYGNDTAALAEVVSEPTPSILTTKTHHAMNHNHDKTLSNTAQRGRVSLAHLTISEDIQVRQRLEPITVTRYANAIRSGQELPPVSVARVDGVLILVDGFHRVAAHQSLGASEVDAELVEATLDEARWMAASANLLHGLPLRNSELRLVFQVFVSTRQHRKGKGKLKSYREIGLELGRPHSTIRNWMAKDFPRIFAQYKGKDEFMGEGGLQESALPKGNVRKGLELIQGFQQVFQATTCPQSKVALTDALQRLALDLFGDGWQEAPSDF
jgi:hypothetical protein